MAHGNDNGAPINIKHTLMRSSVNHWGCEVSAAILAVVCLGHYSLTKHVLLQAVFEFRIPLLLK